MALRAEVPNNLSLLAENLPKRHLDKYKRKRLEHEIYEAAGKIWSETKMPLEEALAVVREAFEKVARDAPDE